MDIDADFEFLPVDSKPSTTQESLNSQAQQRALLAVTTSMTRELQLITTVPSTTMAATTFPRFLELPTEIQMQIWNYAAGSGRETGCLPLDSYLLYLFEMETYYGKTKHKAFLSLANKFCSAWGFNISNKSTALHIGRAGQSMMATCRLSRLMVLERWMVGVGDIPYISTNYLTETEHEFFKDEMLDAIYDLIEAMKKPSARNICYEAQADQ